jgi:hypothetical protein
MSFLGGTQSHKGFSIANFELRGWLKLSVQYTIRLLPFPRSCSSENIKEMCVCVWQTVKFCPQNECPWLHVSPEIGLLIMGWVKCWQSTSSHSHACVIIPSHITSDGPNKALWNTTRLLLGASRKKGPMTWGTCKAGPVGQKQVPPARVYG